MAEVDQSLKVLGHENVAVIGCGVIGRSWATVFARAGANVRVYDAVADAAATVPEKIREDLSGLGLDAGEVEAVVTRIVPAGSLEDAVAGAGWVQESVAEEAAIKRNLFEALDPAAPEDCILASSCSSIPPADFLGGLAGERRALIVHPFNPPHLIPLVELVASPKTAGETVERAKATIEAVGMVPVDVLKPVVGFIGNRLQAAVINEAMHLVADGVASPEDIDATLSIGLGRRWALMGPFETMDLNADGGVGEYMAKFGEAYAAMGAELHVGEGWPGQAVTKVVSARRRALSIDQLPARRAWRDQALMKLNRLVDEARSSEADPRERRR